MPPTVEETVREYQRISHKLRREIKDNPERAREVLIEAGIAEPDERDPSGLRLVKALRSED